MVRLVTISKRWGRGSGTSNNCLEQNKSKEGGKGGEPQLHNRIFWCRILWKLPSRFSSSDYWKCPISKTFNIQIKFSMTRLPQQYLIAQFIVQCNRIINFQSWSTFHVLPFTFLHYYHCTAGNLVLRIDQPTKKTDGRSLAITAPSNSSTKWKTINT